MPWVRIDEGFYQHPKVIQAGPLGQALQIAALCYCNNNLTDGVLSRAAAGMLLDFSGVAVPAEDETFSSWEPTTWDTVASRLVELGMWEAVEGGFKIHDFRDYQPTKREVLRLRKQRSESGRKGGLAKGQANAQASAKASAKQTPEQVPSKSSSKTEANDLAKSKPVPVPVPGSVPGSGSEPVTEPKADQDLAPPRRRDEVWDTLVELFGDAPKSKNLRGAWNAAAKELREHGATPTEIKARFTRYRLAMPEAQCTPTALAKHWGRFAADVPATKHVHPLDAHIASQRMAR